MGKSSKGSVVDCHCVVCCRAPDLTFDTVAIVSCSLALRIPGRLCSERAGLGASLVTPFFPLLCPICFCWQIKASFGYLRIISSHTVSSLIYIAWEWFPAIPGREWANRTPPEGLGRAPSVLSPLIHSSRDPGDSSCLFGCCRLVSMRDDASTSCAAVHGIWDWFDAVGSWGDWHELCQRSCVMLVRSISLLKSL